MVVHPQYLRVQFILSDAAQLNVGPPILQRDLIPTVPGYIAYERVPDERPKLADVLLKHLMLRLVDCSQPTPAVLLFWWHFRGEIFPKK